MIKLALVGGGRMGAVHFKNMISNPLVQCSHIICGTMEESMNLINSHQQTHITQAIDDFPSILNHVDGVIVSSSTPTHYQYIKECLKAKKPVLTEKPMCDTLEQIDDLFEFADKMNCKGIFVAYQRRFDPTVQSIYDQIHTQQALICDDKEFLQNYLPKTIATNGIEKIISTSRDPTYPPIEYLAGNLNGFYDSVVHDVDIVCHLSKEYPFKVYCNANTFYEPIAKINDFDRIFVNLEFKSGILGFVDWCRHSGYSYDQQLKVLGYNGIIEMVNQPQHNMVKYKKDGINNSIPMSYFVDRYDAAYKNELDEFVETIKNDKPIHSTHEQVRNVQIILRAAEQSANLQQPVYIDYDTNKVYTQ